ncbi:MAG: single-stranded DNA-binding protein, partial [Planctomycetota bacterium]
MTKSDSELHKRLQQAAAQLREAVNDFQIEPPVTHVYNPLDYAWAIHCQYLRLAKSSCRILLLGMNPGPWGMAQTGVPFGEVHAVRDWLELGGDVKQPGHEHPKRPISGLDCTRSEVSGQRLWGLMREEFGAREAFFD